MKQITTEQAIKLAMANPNRVAAEFRWAKEDWVKENARYIVAIECKEWDKTLGGEWPQGWKHQMKKEAKARSEKQLLERFLNEECKLLDGAIWLGNWQIIEQLERESADSGIDLNQNQAESTNPSEFPADSGKLPH